MVRLDARRSMKGTITRSKKNRIDKIKQANKQLQEELLLAILTENKLSTEGNFDTILDRWNRFSIRQQVGKDFADWTKEVDEMATANEQDQQKAAMEEDIQFIKTKQARLPDELIVDSAKEFGLNLDENIRVLRDRVDRFIIRKRFGPNAADWDPSIDGHGQTGDFSTGLDDTVIETHQSSVDEAAQRRNSGANSSAVYAHELETTNTYIAAPRKESNTGKPLPTTEGWKSSRIDPEDYAEFLERTRSLGLGDTEETTISNKNIRIKDVVPLSRRSSITKKQTTPAAPPIHHQQKVQSP